MKHYIDKDALAAEIEKYISNYKGILNKIDKSSHGWVDLTLMLASKIDVLRHILSFLSTLEEKEIGVDLGDPKGDKSAKYIIDTKTLEVKEVDLEKEIELVKGDYEQVDVGWNNDFEFIARHFFELGLSVNNPITAADRGMAEEIIINLKRVEQDYRIDLTKEIEWLRNQVKKGE